MQNKRLSTIKNITLLALMLALTIIFCFVPVQFGTITLALMILPTIILSQVASFKTSLAMGVIMGVVNYIAWFTTKAASPVARFSKPDRMHSAENFDCRGLLFHAIRTSKNSVFCKNQTHMQL